MSSSKQAASVVSEGWLGACPLSSTLGDAELMAVHLQMSSNLDGTHRGEVLREGGSKKSTPQGKRGTKTAIWGPQLFFEQRAVEKQKRM